MAAAVFLPSGPGFPQKHRQSENGQYGPQNPFFKDGAGKFITEDDFRPFLEFFPWFHKDFPIRIVFSRKQKDFNMGACRLCPVQTRRHNAGIIEDKDITRS